MSRIAFTARDVVILFLTKQHLRPVVALLIAGLMKATGIKTSLNVANALMLAIWQRSISKKKKAPEGAQEKISISEYIKGGKKSTMEAKQPSYYWRNRDKCLAYAREYRATHKAERKAYYDANQKEILAKQKVRYQLSKLKIMKNGRLTDENK